LPNGLESNTQHACQVFTVDFQQSGSDSNVGIDDAPGNMRHHRMACQSVDPDELPKHGDHRLARAKPARVKDVSPTRSELGLIKGQNWEVHAEKLRNSELTAWRY